MSQRNYTNFARAAAPSSSIASGDTSIDVDTQTDYPDAPYVIVVYEGGDTPPAASKKEVMRVTAVSGTGPYTLDVVRDIDGYNGAGESFTTSATVQHVLIADEAGPQRSFVHGGIGKTDRVPIYADFDVPDQAAGGFQIASGETLTIQEGTASIEDGALRIDSGGIVTFPGSGQRGVLNALIAEANSQDGRTGLIGDYIDSNNYAWGDRQRHDILEVKENVSGTTSTVSSESFTAGQFRPHGRYRITFDSAVNHLAIIKHGETVSASNMNSTFSLGSTLGFYANGEHNIYVDSFHVITHSGNENFA